MKLSVNKTTLIAILMSTDVIALLRVHLRTFLKANMFGVIDCLL